MKRLLPLLLFVFLVACGNEDVLSKDFQSDSEQVFTIMEKSYDEQIDLTDKEEDLFKEYRTKYELGQYLKKDDNDYYEMNDAEKAIYNEMMKMKLALMNIENEEDKIKLSSEENELDYFEELYEDSSDLVDKLFETKNVDQIPDDLKELYPTYEVIDFIYPEEFGEDTKELFVIYDPLVNGDEIDVDEKDWVALNKFLKQYEGNEGHSRSYEQEDKHYLINKYMQEVLDMFRDLRDGIREIGSINQDIIDEFNSVSRTVDNLIID